jgi:hypothetical protein
MSSREQVDVLVEQRIVGLLENELEKRGGYYCHN